MTVYRHFGHQRSSCFVTSTVVLPNTFCIECYDSSAVFPVEVDPWWYRRISQSGPVPVLDHFVYARSHITCLFGCTSTDVHADAAAQSGFNQRTFDFWRRRCGGDYHRCHFSPMAMCILRSILIMTSIHTSLITAIVGAALIGASNGYTGLLRPRSTHWRAACRGVCCATRRQPRRCICCPSISTAGFNHAGSAFMPRRSHAGRHRQFGFTEEFCSAISFSRGSCAWFCWRLATTGYHAAKRIQWQGRCP